MPFNHPHQTFRASPADEANIATIASVIRAKTGAQFVKKSDVLRFALKAAAEGRAIADVIASPATAGKAA